VSAAADKLRKARALIERGWTQGQYARGEQGSGIDFLKRKAVCFCAAGAIGAANKQWPNSQLPGMKYLSLAVGGDGDEPDVLHWNDAPERSQAEVIAAFDKAIALAEAQDA
jgi:hypothetical protein